ncbi:endonuclease [Pseudomonas phage PhiPA3]|uniref:Putative endonuclease n=1 Tax=Pseudomonas phage PhiPA3 TaxID=998086 RepID=F8SJV7_BPPA3|nr:endonuclease [Pseudomonas phage PhiPA3]AEH03502.1 putative endonuclease [Pseudomonas phage PhiPA3]
MHYLDIPAVNGVLTISHVATGSFYMVCATNIRDAAINANGQLRLGTYQSPKLQELYLQSDELDFTFIETADKEESRSIRQKVMAENYGNDKLLNQQDWPKLTGVFKLEHSATGKLIIGTTQDIIKQHSYQATLLRTGKHKCPEFQSLYDPEVGTSAFKFSFSICTDKEEAKSVAQEWIKDAVKRGVYLTGSTVKPAKVEEVGKLCGVYRITFPATGHFYIGSSGHVRQRLAHHKSRLKAGLHASSQVQECYNNNGGEYTTDTIYTDTRDEAYALEQKLIDLHQVDPLFLNFGSDVKSVVKDLWANPEYRDRIINGSVKSVRDPERRKAYGEKMKAYWATPEAKAKRMGGGNPFARKVSVFGIVYGSIMDAVRAKALPDAKLRQRLKDPEDKEVFYVS